MSLPLNQIVCGDCIEIMKTFRVNSIDLIIADPSYGINYHSGRYQGSNPHSRLLHDKTFDATFIKYCKVLLKNNTALFVFGDLANSWANIKRAMGSYYRNTIVWVKNNWTAGDLQSNFGKQYELIVYGIKGRPKIRTKRFSNVWYFDRVNATKLLHPTQKPLELIQRLIQCLSDEGDVVLDPFVGSGTTCVAAQKLGRKWIGIDINPEYVEMAKKRLRKESQKLTKW